MLNRLIISKVRMKILQTYLLNPDQSHHIRGLVRMLEEEINAVRRELKNLELFGIVRSEKQANKLVYTLNKDSIFFQELRSMFLKDTTEIQLISKVLREVGDVNNAIITKAYIAKEYVGENDVDILIIGKPNLSKIGKEMNKVEKEIGRILRMAVMSLEDFEFKRKRRDPYLVDILENEKIVLFGGSRL
jgi:DNA-binding transcriptional regulator YhcF (GntR family)